MVILWDSNDWTILQKLSHNTGIGSMTFSSDSKNLFVGTLDGSIYMWDIQTGKKEHTFEGHNSFVTCMVYSTIKNKNILFSCARDGSLFVWDGENKKIINGFKKAPQDIFCYQPILVLAVRSDGWLVCYCNNEEIYLLELESLLNKKKAFSFWTKCIKAKKNDCRFFNTIKYEK